MNRKILFLCVCIATITLGGTVAGASGDSAKGERLFNKCKACHSLKAGKNKTGPSLKGVIGRRAGSAGGYKYSADLTAAGKKGLRWNKSILFTFLANPTAMIKKKLGKDKVKIKMKTRVKSADKRHDLIAYIAKNAR